MGFADEADRFTLTSDLLRVTFPYILLISLSSLAGAILNTWNRFAVPAFVPTLLNVCMIGFALFLTPYFDPPIMVHEEDKHLAAGGCMHEGAVSMRLGLKGFPAAAEDVMVLRDVELAALTGGRLHIGHLSTAGAVKAVREAKRRGLRVTAEATTLRHQPGQPGVLHDELMVGAAFP